MRHYIGVLAALAFACLAYSSNADEPDAPPVAEPTVKIITLTGHGSGFHIGGGYVVTAAHVVGTQTEVKVKTSLGGDLVATTVFADKVHDLAVVKTDTPNLAKVHLSCRTPRHGEEIEIRGNPAQFEFISSWGRIAGPPQSFWIWRTVSPSNITIAGGVSGGPVIDKDGFVVGVAVGLALQQGRSFMALVVPAPIVCQARDYLGIR